MRFKHIKPYKIFEAKTELGEAGLDKSWQTEFPKETGCSNTECDGKARIAFVTHEMDKESSYVADLHDNDPKGKGLWPHDRCAVALYLCKKCLTPTALFNQA